LARPPARPFDVLAPPGPRPMRDVAFARTIELRTLWIRAREASISLLDWRRQCHSGPPLRRIGPKDIDSTPVFPRYYSPGLPIFAIPHFQQAIERSKLLKGGHHADAFVIAKAFVVQGTAVTMEGLKPNAAKIPNICQHFRIPRMSRRESMEAEGWRF